MKYVQLNFIPLLGLLALTACGGHKYYDSSSWSSANSSASNSSAMTSSMASSMASTNISYSIKVQNLTPGQPLSPVAILLHDHGYHAFTLGSPASVGLEKIAESGDTTTFLADASANPMILKTGRADGITLPGTAMTITLAARVHTSDVAMLELSLAAMLGMTNDGFTALNAVNIGKLGVGESMTLDTLSYDAGTEANTETAASLGAFKGEGFSALRDDTADRITLHPGAVTKDDGLSTSALSGLQRWDNPVARVTILRM